MKCVVDELMVDYFQKGEGQDLVLIHGWNDSKETFKALSDKLAIGYRVTALDLPNFGSSDASEKVVNLHQYSEFLSKFLLKLGIDKYYLLGHSMGGQIAIFAVGQNLLAPNKLVVLAGAGIRNKNTTKKTSLKIMARSFKKITPVKVKKFAYKKIGSDYNPEMSENLKSIINNVLSCDIQQEASKIVCPTLLMYGDSDTSTPLEDGKLLQNIIKNSQLITIPDADHWLHKTKSIEVCRAIRKFLG